MTLSRWMAGLAGLALLIAIVWAIPNAPLSAAPAVIMAEPWWVVTLVDLYAGFILAGIFIFALEPNRLTAALWVVPLFFLGNLVVALWLLVRGPRHLKRLKTRAPRH